MEKINSNGYVPHPLDLSDVQIPAELDPLIMAIAEQVHEQWSLQKMKDGYTYAPVTNSAAKEHCDLMEFDQLEPSHQQYDVITATSTVRLLLKLGWKLIPPEA